AYDVGCYLFGLLFPRQITVEQVALITIDGIVVLFPPLDFTFGNVTLIVVLCVTFATVSLCLNQHRATAVALMIRGLLRDFVTSNDVVAVNDVRGNTVARRFLRQIAHCG